MKSRKVIALLLGLCLFSGLLVPGSAADADDAGTDKGMAISKTATVNADGTYTITLEAYATGSKIITEVNKDIPTDIILVLDQSGSMENAIGTVSFKPYVDEGGLFGTTHTRNKDHYENRHNGGNENLYYPLGDGAYAPVSVTAEEKAVYTQLPNYTNNSTYYSNRNNLYEKVGDEYKEVSVKREGYWPNYSYTYTFSSESITSIGRDTTPNLGTHAPLYARSIETIYTYTYVDANGELQTIGTSTGADTVFGTTLYQKVTNTNGGDSRIDALRSAVSAFANSVAAKAAGEDGQLGTADDIDHRIAVVGFASQSGYGNNTELLSVSGNNSGSVGVAYNSASNQNYKDALQNMNTQAGQTMVTNAINALAAEGATQVDLGVEMAQRILAANPVSGDQQRNRVVIVFTDGSPTTSSGFQLNVANDAISEANTIKSGGATVYSVGIFPGADPTSAGTKPSRNLDKNSSSIPAASNWFMQQVSSNNGTPQTPSYYLSAADAGTLANIFQQISNNIESGGSSTTLNESAVIKDIISPYFTVPEGTVARDISLETYKCTGKSGDAYTWSRNSNAMGATAFINGDQVSVTGFNFAENYVGTETGADGKVTYCGNKLVISFKVEIKDGFLGGNDVPTNSSAGVYENGDAETPVMLFNQPLVNVPIQNVTVTAEDKNVYLLSDITAAELMENATAKVGDVTLDLTKANDSEKPYGLEPWQTAYVDISLALVDDTGTETNILNTGFTGLTDDQKYGLKVTVTPKTLTPNTDQGAMANVQGDKQTQNVNVFKPELTYKDSEVWYGGAVPTREEFDDKNLYSEKWQHSSGSSESAKDYSTDADITMLGSAPSLTKAYTPDKNKIKDGKVNTMEDIPVDVAVKIGQTDVTNHTTFVHDDCGGKTCTVPEGKEFLLHVKDCQLTISKSGAPAREYGYDGFIFKVTDSKGQQVAIVAVSGNDSVTIGGLTYGETYTITEDGYWSKLYTCADVTKKLEAESTSVTMVNTFNNTNLLNGGDSATNRPAKTAE